MKRLLLVIACVVPAVAFGAAPVVDQSTAANGTPSNGSVRKASVSADTATLRMQLADLTLEIEQLRTELRELRGQLETQTHELESLKTRNREALSDMDKRLREQERRSAPASSSNTAPQAPEPTAEVPKGTTVTPPTPEEQQQYDTAFALMKQGYYEKAGKGFRDFVAKHSTSELAGHAQYWSGEAQYVMRNFKSALDEFSKVTDKYPSSPKVPDALLKIGYCQQELGALDKARETLQQVIKRYPNTTTAKSAEKRLTELKSAEPKKAAESKTKSADAKPKVAETKKR